MRVYTETITFDGGGAKTLAAAATRTRAYKIYVEPGDGNTHAAYIGDSSLAIGTSTTDHVIKRLAPPSSGTAIVDKWEHYGEGVQNGVELAQFTFDGTSGEKLRVSLFE